MFTGGMGGGSTEGTTGRRKSEANCLFWILIPTLSSVWPWTSHLTSLHFCLLVCKTRTLTFFPHKVIMSFMSALRWVPGPEQTPHGVNSPYVEKLLHCFSIKINRIPLGLILFQKLEELVESLCLTWERQSVAQGKARLPRMVPGSSSTPPPTTLTSLFSMCLSVFTE